MKKKIILIANNKSIKNETIRNLELDENTLVILFNHQMPFQWKKIKNHPNKVVFLRFNGSYYWGENLYKKRKKFYKKAYKLHIAHIIDNKEKIPLFDKEQLEEIGFKKKSPTSGFCVYSYVMKYLYEDDTEVYMIGFTLNYPSMPQCHSKEVELNYYNKEKEKELRVTWIDQ